MPKISLRHPFRLATLTDDLNNLPEHMRDYNVEHHALCRINRDTFRFDTGLGVELMPATTVHHWMDFHLVLCSDEDIPGLTPAYYDNFAAAMNAHDGSGYGWAQLDENGAIIWDNSLDPADPETFCVLDSDINPRVYLRSGEAAITNVELLDYRRLKDAETKANVKWRMKRVDEKTQKEQEAGGLVKVSLDVFAKKRKRLQRSADELAAVKKARIDDDEEEGEVPRPASEILHPENLMNVDPVDNAGPSGPN